MSITAERTRSLEDAWPEDDSQVISPFNINETFLARVLSRAEQGGDIPPGSQDEFLDKMSAELPGPESIRTAA